MKTERKNKFILGMGSPLLDISAVVPDDFLEKYNVKPNNAILAEEKHQRVYKEMINTCDVEYVAGGATLNAIRVAQWMLQRPGQTTFIGAIGHDDEFGYKLEESCINDSVHTLFHKVEDYETGTCAVLVNNEGERSLIANLAAANKYSHVHTMSTNVQDKIRESDVYYVSSFFMSVPDGLDSIMSIAKYSASSVNKYFCINLAAPFIIQMFSDKLNAILPYADYIFCNETEAQEIAKKRGWDHTDLEIAALRLAGDQKASGTHPRTVVITQGPNSTIVASSGVVKQFPVEPLEKHRLVDTNGAGDAFVGGFLARLSQGHDISECINAGHYSARTIILHPGCTFPGKS